jgi:hypothetical protein
MMSEKEKELNAPKLDEARKKGDEDAVFGGVEDAIEPLADERELLQRERKREDGMASQSLLL